jgi:hypothetical protein
LPERAFVSIIFIFETDFNSKLSKNPRKKCVELLLPGWAWKREGILGSGTSGSILTTSPGLQLLTRYSPNYLFYARKTLMQLILILSGKNPVTHELILPRIRLILTQDKSFVPWNIYFGWKSWAISCQIVRKSANHANNQLSSRETLHVLLGIEITKYFCA